MIRDSTTEAYVYIDPWMRTKRSYTWLSKEGFSYSYSWQLCMFLEINLVKSCLPGGAVKVVVEYGREIVGTFEIRGI